MNFAKIFLTLFILTAHATVNAQQIKPKFKKLQCATYTTDLSGKDTIVICTEYIEINEIGQANYKSKIGRRVDLFMDTTYQLTDTLIAKLNKIFDGNSKLYSYMIADKLPNGTHYGGPLKFIRFTDNNGITQNFIDVRPLMSRNFTVLLDEIVHRPKTILHKTEPIQNKSLEDQIIKCQNSCGYTPKVEQPPTVIRIIKADPVINH